ncbi:hypothetical protein [Hymenobacter arizonensis]|uniref:hypothetical protein n=1 Tax=Hymenobacter arizonensis TaxID=1227077 RepID=UPI0011600C50|nr:hypothetical protein [Hymenobacter arizonensis]
MRNAGQPVQGPGLQHHLQGQELAAHVAVAHHRVLADERRARPGHLRPAVVGDRFGVARVKGQALLRPGRVSFKGEGRAGGKHKVDDLNEAHVVAERRAGQKILEQHTRKVGGDRRPGAGECGAAS